MSEKLKCCPLCGGVATVHEYKYKTAHNFTVYCEDCGLATQWYDTEAEAVKAWNTRAERTCHYVFTTNYALPDDPQEDYRADYYMCDKCGYWVPDFRWEDEDGYAYCPNCGAKVVEE